MLGSAVLATRLGGIIEALVSLAKENPPYRAQTVRLLCAFIRHPADDADAQPGSTPGKATGRPPRTCGRMSRPP